MANVLVKLIRPWVATQDGSLRLKLGHEEPMVDESRRDRYGRPLTVPGKAVYVTLTAEEGKDEALIPDEWARLYFGDERSVSEHFGDDRDYRITRGPKGQIQESIPTWSEQADEVARNWGDYRRASERGMKQDDPRFPTPEPIGPPQMPHVLIFKTDVSGKPVGEPYDPWEALGYNERWPDFEETEDNRKLLVRL